MIYSLGTFASCTHNVMRLSRREFACIAPSNPSRELLLFPLKMKSSQKMQPDEGNFVLIAGREKSIPASHLCLSPTKRLRTQVIGPYRKIQRRRQRAFFPFFEWCTITVTSFVPKKKTMRAHVPIPICFSLHSSYFIPWTPFFQCKVANRALHLVNISAFPFLFIPCYIKANGAESTSVRISNRFLTIFLRKWWKYSQIFDQRSCSTLSQPTFQPPASYLAGCCCRYRPIAERTTGTVAALNKCIAGVFSNKVENICSLSFHSALWLPMVR